MHLIISYKSEWNGMYDDKYLTKSADLFTPNNIYYVWIIVPLKCIVI